MVTGFDHVHIFSADVEKMGEYFIRIFDGQDVSRGEMRGFPVIRMKVQGIPFVIMGTDPKTGQFETGKGIRGLDHIGFKASDLDSTAADLQKRGAKFTLLPTVGPTGLKIAFLEAPEGMRIELVERN